MYSFGNSLEEISPILYYVIMEMHFLLQIKKMQNILIKSSKKYQIHQCSKICKNFDSDLFLNFEISLNFFMLEEKIGYWI